MNFSCFSEDYVQRLATGDPEVENHFTGYFGGLLHIKLKTKLRSANAIEDVRQETFLRVLATLRDGRLLYPDRLGGFVNSVCNNVLLETYRDKQKHWPMQEHTPEPADACADLESDLVTRERKEMVERILDELSPKDREILRMIFLEEQDRADICRKLKVNGEYLRVLVFRAKERFRDAMHEDAPPRSRSNTGANALPVRPAASCQGGGTRTACA